MSGEVCRKHATASERKHGRYIEKHAADAAEDMSEKDSLVRVVSYTKHIAITGSMGASGRRQLESPRTGRMRTSAAGTVTVLRARGRCGGSHVRQLRERRV